MPDNLIVELPWPPTQLWPNRRYYWRVVRKTAAKYKHDCLCLMPLKRFLESAFVVPADGKIHLSIVFCPPNRIRRDLDGMLSAIKQGIDALAERLGVDDSRFVYTLDRGDVVKGGAVRVEVRS